MASQKHFVVIKSDILLNRIYFPYRNHYYNYYKAEICVPDNYFVDSLNVLIVSSHTNNIKISCDLGGTHSTVVAR